MFKAADTLVHLGNHAGFEDKLRATRRVLMGYLWVFPVLGFLYYKADPPFSGAFLSWILAAVVAVLLFLKFLRYIVRIELVLDRERQQLLIRRKVFWFQTLESLAGVEELQAVTAAGEVPAAPVNYWWDYVVLLITRSGQRFRGKSYGKDYVGAAGGADQLSQELGIPYLPSHEGAKVVVSPGVQVPDVEFRPFNLARWDMVAVVFWAFMIFISPALFLSLLFS